MVKNKDRWSALSMSERAEIFKIGVKNGITDRNTIIKMYNSFGEGGPIKTDEYGYPADIAPAIIEADYPREAEVWKRADASNADMVQRLKQGSSRATIQDWEDPRKVATHKMMSAGNYVVGNVQNINGQLFDFTDPKHGFEDPDRAAIDSAIERGDYVKFDTEGDARYFAEHYKKHYNSFNPGGEVETKKTKEPLLDPKKIVKNVSAREWGPVGITEEGNYVEGEGTNLIKSIIQYFGDTNTGEVNESIISKFFEDVKNGKLDLNDPAIKEIYEENMAYKNHLEGLKKFLNLPYDETAIVESEHKPTKSIGTDDKYYKFTHYNKDSISSTIDDMLLGGYEQHQYLDPTLNTFTAYRDRDDKGDFISILDTWDYNPSVRGGYKFLDGVIPYATDGNPFDIYDRFYLDDYYDVPEAFRGNPYITPAVVTAESKKSNGGKLNKFDIGGPTREMTPLEAAALNKTLNNSQYMLAVGDSPDDPAYLSTDLLEPAVVKAFNSEEDYNRYQGEKFGEYVSNEISKAGTKLAPVLVGAAATPWAISGGIAAYTNPITRSIIDLAGSIDGIRNAASKNGVRKTIRLAKEGDVWGTTKSAIGDIFDIAGGIGLAGDVYRYGKGASKRLAEAVVRIGDNAPAVSAVIEQILNKKALNYIFNPYADPNLAYNLPYTYSGVGIGEEAYKGDVVDKFFRKVPVVNSLDPDSIPSGLKSYISDVYPHKDIRYIDLGSVKPFGDYNKKVLQSLQTGESIKYGEKSGGIYKRVGFFSRPVLDPGGFNSVYKREGNDLIHEGFDIWKFNADDYMKRYGPTTEIITNKRHKLNDFIKKYKLQKLIPYLGLKFIDSMGTPVVHKFTYTYPNYYK